MFFFSKCHPFLPLTSASQKRAIHLNFQLCFLQKMVCNSQNKKLKTKYLDIDLLIIFPSMLITQFEELFRFDQKETWSWDWNCVLGISLECQGRKLEFRK
jgi:hypothetical protein